MIDEETTASIQAILNEHFTKGEKYFIFGSALKTKNFSDIDIAIQNLKNPKALNQAKEALENSSIPYKIDLIDFDKTDKSFQTKILNQKILWLT
ncbi:nucleotidyltransferase domain-containing protein [Patescibacteria group bacterium]|nr:nucleotidyltransferase domain-containing protein [Patescibacteria group bacterium]